MKELFKNQNSFMTGRDPFVMIKGVEAGAGSWGSEIVFENHHEGFIGIPHGGVAMGLCLDLWRNLPGAQYPVKVSFRFAGTGISIGDKAILEVEGASGFDQQSRAIKITKLGDRKPYLTATFKPLDDDFCESPSSMPSNEFRPLPYYKNCLVCGHHRAVVGLKRQFRYHEVGQDKMVTVVWGQNDEDLDRAKFFLIGENELHPFVLIAIFDENTAWGGFMETRRGGLSVKLDFLIRRPVQSTEKLLFIGRPAGIRGASSSPRFFSARGEILSLSDPKSPEVVAHGWGEWVVLKQYTEQIRNNLIPKSDVEWLFGPYGQQK